MVLLVNVVTHLTDVQATLQRLHAVVHPRTRVLIYSYSRLWQPLLRVAVGLHRGFDREPSSAYRSNARLELLRHMRENPRPSPPPQGVAASLRIVFSLVLLVLLMLVSGTAYAQGSLPGDSFYSWKIASERAWRAVSRDPVGADLFLAERRVNEYRSVSGDAQRSQKALKGYGEVLIRLSAESDTNTRERIEPVLKNHEQSLKNAGVDVPELDQFLNTTGPGNGFGSLYTGTESMNSATMPWIKNVDLRVTRGFRISGRDLTVFADFRNLFNWTNLNSIFAETGDVVNDKYKEIWLSPYITALENEAGGLWHSQAVTKNGVTSTMFAMDLNDCSQYAPSKNYGVPNCLMLRRTEERFGNGDHVFDESELNTAMGQFYLANNGPWTKYGAGLNIRFGFEFNF